MRAAGTRRAAGEGGVALPVSAAAREPGSKLARLNRGRHGWSNYIFILPWFVGLAALTVGPLLSSLALSFTDFRLSSTPQVVGVDNYTRLLTADPRAVAALLVTVIYVVVSVPLTLLVALSLALALNSGVRFVGVFRSMFYLPSLLGGSVAIAVLWRQVFGAEGLFNDFLGIFGVAGPGSWVSDPDTSLSTIIVLHAWQFGSPMVIFLAGLKQLPREPLEAAEIDGAGSLRRLWSVTLPLLTPVIFFALVMQVIGSFAAFTPAYVVSNGTGGPIDSLLFYSLYIYEVGFVNFQMGYASALAWTLLVIIAASTSLLFWSSKKWVYEP